MSDARNSSNSLRGGGAKQTGGAGRTHKFVGHNHQRNGLLTQDLEKKDARTEAKRLLQLQIMSKQLANSVRAACLTNHTEEEFEEFNIPMPDPGSALKKLKAMREFTQNWYDKEFRDEWLQRVTEIWEKELMDEYARAFAAEKERREAANQHNSQENEPMSIEELEAKIASLEPGSEERTKLKKKLKKKKQKQNKKENAATNDDDLD
jgi:hypothetical protein